MSDGRVEMLAAIRANPADDAPRLAFADWLDEQGESDFARYIRLELERDRLPKTDPRWKALRKQVWALPKTPKGWESAGVSIQTKRGLPFYLETGIEPLRDALDRIGPYAPEPFVLLHGGRQSHQEAEAELTRGGADRVGDAIRDLFRSPWVRGWYELQLDSIRITGERARWMAEAGNLAGLATLSLTDGADDDAVRVLCGAHLPRLTVLGVREVMRSCSGEPLLTAGAVHALLDSPVMDGLEGLVLCGSWLRDDSLRALAECPRVARLKSLFVWPGPDSSAGVQAVLDSPHLAGLTRLDLSGIALNSEMAARLARPDVLPGLRTLIIGFEAAGYRAALRPRFGEGLFVGTDEEPQE